MVNAPKILNTMNVLNVRQFPLKAALVIGFSQDQLWVLENTILKVITEPQKLL